MVRNEEILVAVDDTASATTTTTTDINANGGFHHHIPNPNTSSCNPQGTNYWGTLSLAYKSLGVVFGGLVTSPLYVYPSMGLKSPTKDDYLGIYSIMFWTLTSIGVVKYACIALRADDQGEVLSAMDGIRGPFPKFSKSLVGALSAVVLIGLFLLQKFGTARVSFLFSPIMGAWTLTTPIIGIYNVIHHYPSIFKAISPHYIFLFFWRNGHEGWLLLNGTILCITADSPIFGLCTSPGYNIVFLTLPRNEMVGILNKDHGSEALFADLGHFDRPSIQIAFISLIYPSLILTYAGQTAYLIQHPNDHEDGFYKFIPRKVYWPMFVISSLAAIVASQSLISATFSVIKQSVVLDYFPRIKIVHTSSSNEGQVYSPETNYTLMVLCVAVILIFGDGKEIGNAFGVVIILVMLITTLLLTLVMIVIWRLPTPLVALFSFVFLTMEGLYASSVFTKIEDGGWIPFAISLILAFIMFGWFYGRQRKMEYELTHKINTERLKDLLSDPGVQRVPGLCFFYTNIQDGFTPVLSHYIKNMRSIHKVTIFTTLRYLLVPKVAPNKRIVVKRFGLKGVYGCLIQYGYADNLSLQGDFVTQVIGSLRDHITQHFTENPPVEEQEMTDLNEAQHAAVVHVRGKTRFYISKKCTWFDRFMLGFYEFMHSNCRSALPTLGVPLQQRIEVGMFYEA
ncbi:hypothetical protein OSB04_019387 [Centaurea solstitialis]|uniref:Potassium transporter n=1 Tax=Centaurea solstitialis TaxID=347529 RepID=A0AA38WE75_9ASTR|nr:hypothetical protein OSB04_019387 [Centaurea solstitialis]